MSGLSIRVEAQEGRSTVSLAGECDIGTAPKLQEALQTLRPPDVTHVVLDATDLEFLDSTGLAVIVSAFKRLKEADGALSIACPHGAVQRVLEISGLDQVIPIIRESSGG